MKLALFEGEPSLSPAGRFSGASSSATPATGGHARVPAISSLRATRHPTILIAVWCTLAQRSISLSFIGW